MLIEFSVSNYRSFREKQTFSMVAAPRLKKKENLYHPNVNSERNFPKLLKMAAIYGPNASGKSNLLQALSFVNRVISMGPKTIENGFPVSGFRFDSNLRDSPSNFEYHFIANGMRYEYTLSANTNRVFKESLAFYPQGKFNLLFERIHIENKGDDYKFGTQFEENHIVLNAWRKLTGPLSLFIQKAYENSSEDFSLLRAPYEWLRRGFSIIEHDWLQHWSNSARNVARHIPGFNQDIVSFLSAVDIPVTNIRIDRFDGQQDNDELNTNPSIEEIRDFPSRYKTTLTHKTNLGEADFDFSEESTGTQNLFGFVMPWIIMKYSKTISNNFEVLLIDEFDSSLHPNVVAKLVELHQHTDSGIQLIFTTHDTHLMDAKLLRRDQLWLTERDGDGATLLRSIHDFEGRESEDVEKRYYEGKYRGLPIIKRLP